MRSPRLTPMAFAGVVALSTLGACGGDKPGPTGPTGPTAGVLRVQLTAPSADQGAVLLTIAGPAVPSAVVAAQPGVTAHVRTTNSVTTVALFGAVAAGEILRLSVPDVGAVASYRADVREVAGRDNALREDLTPYRATVTRADK